MSTLAASFPLQSNVQRCQFFARDNHVALQLDNCPRGFDLEAGFFGRQVLLPIMLIVGSLPRSASEGSPSPDCIIKGNINRNGERIYHMPDQQFYAQISGKRARPPTFSISRSLLDASSGLSPAKYFFTAGGRAFGSGHCQ